ncbi:MAG TPA: hypothetical protein VFG63_05860 [Nocardioidaceae bacterium]|nr:hypothetical protein [Nocardioidaceae bacterium]
MTPERIAFVLTALAAVVVVLTRVRLASSDDHGAGRLGIPPALVNVHTAVGVVAILLWGWFLLGDPGDLVGWIGLACFWVTAVAGLLILARWLPARGRHAASGSTDSWGEGPGLSVLAHVGMVVGCVVWTVFLVAGKL